MSFTDFGSAGPVSRMAPGASADVEAHQGWALASYPPDGARERGHDLLFIHGMAAGGLVWPPEWTELFTRAGFRCWTLTLPGRPGGANVVRDPAVLERALAHVARTGDAEAGTRMLLRALPGASLLDGPNLDDLAQAASEALARIGRPAVLVGHSLGGAVAQALLRRGEGPAGTVLLASVPPYGTWRASMQMALTDPALWRTLSRFALSGLPGVDPDVMRRALFPGGIGARRFAALMEGMQGESLAALAQAQGLPPFAPLPVPRGDMLVIGGWADALIPPLDVAMTAGWYGTQPRMVPGAGHMIMHGATAQLAAAEILGWCEGLEARAPQAA